MRSRMKTVRLTGVLHLEAMKTVLANKFALRLHLLQHIGKQTS